MHHVDSAFFGSTIPSQREQRNTGYVQQFEVIKQISLTLARMLEEDLQLALGREIPVHHHYEARKGESLTLIQTGVQRRSGNVDREYEVVDGQEQFRNPPLLMRAHYLVSAWAKPPEDQALLGAVLRTFLDRPNLTLEGDATDMVAYAGIPSIDLDTLSTEEHRLLSSTLGVPFAPSVGYYVEFRLRSGQVTVIKRVRERVMDFRKIEG
jgi:hypothetical protein